MDDLAPPNTARWVICRKAAVVAAVRSGRITMEETLRCYQLTEEEFLSWQQRAFETHGLAGLRATRVQQYGGPRPPRGPRSPAKGLGSWLCGPRLSQHSMSPRSPVK